MHNFNLFEAQNVIQDSSFFAPKLTNVDFIELSYVSYAERKNQKSLTGSFFPFEKSILAQGPTFPKSR